MENKIYNDDMEIAEDIQDILIRHATGGARVDTDEEDYSRMRKFFLDREITKKISHILLLKTEIWNHFGLS